VSQQEIDKLRETLRETAGQRSLPSNREALEGPVDPDAYVVGPGDVFSIAIGGSAARQTITTVAIDGALVIPEAGVIQAAGRSLRSVRAEARAALSRRFRNVTADVALITPRRFLVHVSGPVLLPGRQAVPAVARVEDALNIAMANSGARQLAAYDVPIVYDVERRPALRNVRVTSPNGEETLVDLMRYFATGDTDSNPYLRDGDAIHVSTFDPVREGVSVSGAVDTPGTYDVRPNDTARDLLEVVAGENLSDRVASIRLTRASGETLEASLAEAATLRLELRDQLYVVPTLSDAGLANIVGAVRFPGTYPIDGDATLSTLVERAGGLRNDALVSGAYLERSARVTPEEVLDPMVATGAPLGRPGEAAPTVAQLSALPLVSRRYYLQEYVARPRVSIDLGATLAGTEAVALRDGDRLVVPFDLGTVRVYGQVGEPGYVPFEAGLSAAEYVERAGALGPAAREVYTIRVRTGQFVAGNETLVEAGDEVFVDRIATSDDPTLENIALQQVRDRQQQDRDLQQQERDRQQLTRDRRQFFFQTFSIVLSTIGTITTVVLTLNAVGN